jgi:hypothetical protein
MISEDEPTRPGRFIRRLLIRLSILAALVALAWYGIQKFLDAQIIALSSRTGADLRSLSVALEAYHFDHGEYPAMIPLVAFMVNPEGISERPDLQRATVIDPGAADHAGLTTPIAYISALYSDICAPSPLDGGSGGGNAMPYLYHTDGRGWILISRYNDGDCDIDPARDYDSAAEGPTERLILAGYDPTNGARSSGDLWRISQQSRSLRPR